MDFANSSVVTVPIDTATPPSGLVSEWVSRIFILVNYVFLMGVVSLMGVVFNLINVVVFVKQGAKDTVTLSLVALSVSDLLSVTFHLWQSLCYAIWFAGPVTDINFRHLQYITASWPSGLFGRISSWLTVFISLERCLCVAVPLKVKGILTPRRAMGTIMAIYLIMAAINLPVFYAVGLRRYFFTSYNNTMLGFYYRPHGFRIEQISLSILGASQTISFLLIVVFTAVLTFKLKSKSKWRQSVTTSGAEDSVSSRDKRVSKMVLAVCLVFIGLLCPYWFSGVAMAIFPEYNNLGVYRNIFVSVFSIVLTLEALCSTINIFVYYNMSSRYADTFRQLFCRGSKAVAKDA